MTAGSIPQDQRRLAVIVAGSTAVAMVVGSLIVNYVAGSPVDWFWLVAGSLFVTMLITLFLWVRLSE
jgi:hypothetical protein